MKKLFLTLTITIINVATITVAMNTPGTSHDDNTQPLLSANHRITREDFRRRLNTIDDEFKIGGNTTEKSTFLHAYYANSVYSLPLSANDADVNTISRDAENKLHNEISSTLHQHKALKAQLSSETRNKARKALSLQLTELNNRLSSYTQMLEADTKIKADAIRQTWHQNTNTQNTTDTTAPQTQETKKAGTSNQNAQWSTGEKAGLTALVIAACGGMIALTKDSIMKMLERAQSCWTKLKCSKKSKKEIACSNN